MKKKDALSKIALSQMSQRDYISAKGIKCPCCRGEDCEGTESVQVDGGTGIQEIRCNSCNSRWTDIYSLTGYHLNLDGRK